MPESVKATMHFAPRSCAWSSRSRARWRWFWVAADVHVLEFQAGGAAAVVVGWCAPRSPRCDSWWRPSRPDTADRSFAGQHDGAGAVVNGVGNVGNLGAGRARVFGHGFEHLVVVTTRLPREIQVLMMFF